MAHAGGQIEKNNHMKKHPKCRLEVYHGPDGTDYDCDYEHAPECDACIYGPLWQHGGRGIDPETGKVKYVRKMRPEIQAPGPTALDDVRTDKGPGASIL